MTIVLSDDYSEQLEKTAFRSPVWLADTPANRTAAEAAWHAAVEWPHISVTLFRAAENPTRNDWVFLLDQIQLNREVGAIDVVGAPLSLPARAAFIDNGFTRFDESANGFRARR